jgi:dynein heavy chain 1
VVLVVVQVQDVEAVDPILNPVLNREFQRTGGRTILRLGNEDIDYSPQFVLFMVTRNPTAAFTPDLCSRVTLVNFTVTPASLQAQVHNKHTQSRHGPGHSPRGRVAIPWTCMQARWSCLNPSLGVVVVW